MIKKLNTEKIKVNSNNIMSSKEALKDVVPIQYSEDILSDKNELKNVIKYGNKKYDGLLKELTK